MARTKRKKISREYLDMGDYAHVCKDLSNKKVLPSSDPLWDKNPLHRIERITKDNDFCFISIEEKRIVITFNPSDDFEDWRSNKDYKRDEEDIHRGWHESAKKFYDDILKVLKDHRNDNKEILLCGASRGGSLAKITGNYIAERGYPCEVYPFVDPRVGGEKYKEKSEGLPIKIHSLHQVCGIVDDVPPKIFGFVDMGDIKYLRPKWWYFLLPPVTRLVVVHKDWYDNLKRQV